MDVRKVVCGFAEVALVAVLLGSCVSYTGVQRIESNRDIDLSGRWNDTDSRDVAAAMIDQILEGRWLTVFRRGNRDTPSVVVGTVLNRTHEHIATNTFVTDVERALINSGDVRVLQGGEFREQLRAERADQQEFASPATAARLGVEIGADFILQGTISSIVDSSGRQQLIFYQVDLELTSVETAEKVWIGSHQIRKLVTR
jgi:penicillin-binding protein activator